jgi:hypothetical protein
VRSRWVVLGAAAALLAPAGCDNTGTKAQAAAPAPVDLVKQQPAASAGGACILWDYPFIKEKIGVDFTVAAAGSADDTSTCVVQTVTGDWPDLTLSVVESTAADADLFSSELKPEKASTLKGLGKAGYRLNTGAKDGHGPTVEIGWLSQAKQLQSLRFTFAKGAKQSDITAMNTKLLDLAKAMNTTNG